MRRNLRIIIGTLSILSVSLSYAFQGNPDSELNDINSSEQSKPNNVLLDALKNQVTGVVNPADVIKAQEAANASMQKSLGLQWESRGPTNFGGKATCVLYDQDDNSRIFIGSATGGLFVSHTGGSSWEPASEGLGSLIVSSITQASNGDIYVGTGLSYGPYTDYVGGGIYKSTNSGVSFVELSSTWSTATNPEDWEFVAEMAASPSQSTKIYAATKQGLMVTYDGGTVWTNVLKSKILYLSGENGNAEVTVEGNSYTITYSSSLSNTAQNFVSTHGNAIRTSENIEVVSQGEQLLFFGLDGTYPNVSIANTDGGVAKVSEIVLTGTQGAADVIIDGITYTATKTTTVDAAAASFASGTSIADVTLTSTDSTIILTGIAGSPFTIDTVLNTTGSIAQVDKYEFVGDSGSVVLTINSASYIIEFDTDETTTVNNFVLSDDAAEILSDIGVVVSSNADTLILTAQNAGYPFVSSIVTQTPVAQQVDHVIAGSCGAADILINGSTYSLTYSGNIDQTVSDFITADSTTLSGLGITASGNDNTISLAAIVPGVPFTTYASQNTTGYEKQMDQYTFTGTSGAVLLQIYNETGTDSSEYIIPVFNGDVNAALSDFFINNVMDFFSKGLNISVSGNQLTIEAVYAGVGFTSTVEELVTRAKRVEFTVVGDSGIAYISMGVKNYEMVFQGTHANTALDFYNDHADSILFYEGITVTQQDSILIFQSMNPGVDFPGFDAITTFGNLSATANTIIENFPVSKQVQYELTGTTFAADVKLPVGGLNLLV
ncbi:MAG: hypothetical protein HRT72_14090, partial [Flavobacteriales bacterium]|nr:hypothetical protein [Flavobacteriales bacterium]